MVSGYGRQRKRGCTFHRCCLISSHVLTCSLRWVHAAARILKNTAGRAANDVKTRYARLLDGWRDRRDACGTLGDAVNRFLKVTDSYRPGLFHYLEVPGLPATNNDLEQFFGAQSLFVDVRR